MTSLKPLLSIPLSAALLAGCATSRPMHVEVIEVGSPGVTTNFEPVAIDIPAGPASESIYQWGKQTNAQYLVACRDLEGVNTRALQAFDYPERELRTLLEGTGLTVIAARIDSFAIVREQQTPTEHP